MAGKIAGLARVVNRAYLGTLDIGQPFKSCG
jgi:hypothetical protein